MEEHVKENKIRKPQQNRIYVKVIIILYDIREI